MSGKALLYWLTWQPQFEYTLAYSGERRGFAPERRREEDNVGGATRGERLGRDRAEEDDVGASGGHWRPRLVPLNQPSEFADASGARESTIVERGCTLPRPVLMLRYIVYIRSFERIRTLLFVFLYCVVPIVSRLYVLFIADILRLVF